MPSWSHAREHCLGQSYASRERCGMQTSRGEKPSSIILATSLPTQSRAKVFSALSVLHASRLCSCCPPRLLSRGPVPLAEHLPWSVAVTLLSLESQETITHQSFSFSCCTNDPQPCKMSYPSVIITSAWQLWDSLEQRHEEEHGQPWLRQQGNDPRKSHAGINRRLQKAGPELETQNA